MGKRLPYFQFEVAEWLAGDIMFCSFEAQGLFVNLMALYWQKDCELNLDQAIKRLKSDEMFKELIDEKIIKIDSGKISINFLDEQFYKASEKSRVNSMNGSLGGRPKKEIESENKPNGFNLVSESKSEKKPIREDKIKEEEIKENKIKESIPNGVVDLKNQSIDTKIDFDKIISFFNSNNGNLPKVKNLSDPRKKRLLVLEKKHGKKSIQTVIEKVRDSNFLQGENKDNWIASFDWICKPENFIKILEDNFINRVKPNNGFTNTTKTAYKFDADRIIETHAKQYKMASVDSEKIVPDYTDYFENGNIPGKY
ncbi:hypothetical protein [uncultured Flavobacterium sp.]|uniref:hypothetical protein n=1 Tax=uncultured Flavobacterium sp. TaxID=165435 RepID=UPI0030EF2EF7|tara:strand:+ start:3328 stop:4260 length:933 start_codon:yes stop_codon:yes gene_type:complete